MNKYTLRLEPRISTISNIVQMITNGKLKLKVLHNYSVTKWNVDFKSKFIESILLGIPITTIILNGSKDNEWYIINGHNEIYTIIDFIEDNFDLEPLDYLFEYNSKRYSQLPRSIQNQFKNTEIFYYLNMPNTSDDMCNYLYEYTTLRRDNNG